MSADPITTSFAPLHELSSLVTSSLSTLEATCKDVNTPWPSLDEPTYMSKTGIRKEDFIRMKNEAIVRASAQLVAAAMQLVCSVREPFLTVAQAGGSHLFGAAVRTVTEFHVVDILRDVGTEGLHVNDIAKKLQTDPSKLARILRYLSTHHIFTEVRPNVFANNRISATLEKGQPIEALLEKPETKYDHPVSAIASLVGHMGDDFFSAAGQLFETLARPETAFSGSPSKCSLVVTKLAEGVASSAPHEPATGTMTTSSDDGDVDLSGPTVWDLMAREEPPKTRFGFKGEAVKRFGVGMDGASKMQPVAEILQGFDFVSLPPASLVVDVGGGIGAVAQMVLQRNGNLKTVVQDRKEVCEQGTVALQNANPRMLESGQVTFQAHNFFSPQLSFKIKPSVFILKSVLHDWSDPYCRVILKHLRDAAGDNKNTTLLVMDNVLSYGCRPSSAGDQKTTDAELDARNAVPGTYQKPAPPPLLQNWGESASFAHLGDIAMLVAFNGQERTLSDFRNLLRSAGWEIVKITQPKTIGHPFSMIEAKAV